MGRPPKNKEQKEVIEDDGKDIEEQLEEVQQPVELEPQEDLAPTYTLEERKQQLQLELDELTRLQEQDKFIATAPKRMNELENGVKENRKYLMLFNDIQKEMQTQLAALLSNRK